MPEVDWLTQLLRLITVTGRLEVRCTYGAPWRVAWPQSAAHEIPYHIVLKGRAILIDSRTEAVTDLRGGDIVLLPHGSEHVLHDGSGDAPAHTHNHRDSGGWMVSENEGGGERLDLLCGKFLVKPPHDRLIRNYLPTNVVARGSADHPDEGVSSASHQLTGLLGLMRIESTSGRLGGTAVLNALSTALFALVLRAASESDHAPAGLLALAGHPRLGPAISALFANPARAWKLPELADMCSMSRATFMRQFQEKFGHSAMELLTDIRMGLAANDLKKPGATTAGVGESVGYLSEAAFRRAFAEWMGMTPGQWRRSAPKEP